MPAPPVDESALAALEIALGHRFAERAGLVSALTHRSFANDFVGPDGTPIEDYQRLEFLGDAVVGCIMADLLYRKDPHAREGVLTLRRAALVREARLAAAARELGVPTVVRVGNGDEARAFPERDSVLADVFEALVAAIWLDAGADGRMRVEALVARLFADNLGSDQGAMTLKPAKSRLQELAQERWKITPRYRVLDANEYTPDPQAPTTVELAIGDVLTVRASGQSRRDAEIRAAELAIEHIHGDSAP
jgi:ribonuclease-3